MKVSVRKLAFTIAGFILGCVSAPVVGQSYQVRNYLPQLEEQRDELFPTLGFGLYERVETLHREQGPPVYRYALCQYGLENRQVVFPDFTNLSDHRIRYDQVTGDYRQECHDHGDCSEIGFVEYLEQNPPPWGQSWFYEGTIIETDSQTGLSCVYYMNGLGNHHADLFFQIHESMDHLMDCPERDRWVSWSPVILAGVIVASRFPALGARALQASTAIASRTAAGAGFAARLGSIAIYLQVFQKLAERGTLNPVHAQRLDQVLNFILNSAVVVGTGMTSHLLHEEMVARWPWYSDWYADVTDFVSGKFHETADFYEDVMIGDSRHLLGQDHKAYFSAAYSSGYPRSMSFARLSGIRLLDYIHFKRQLMHGKCLSESTGLGNPRQVYKIKRHDEELGSDYLELYYGNSIDAHEIAHGPLSIWGRLQAYWSQYGTLIDLTN